MKTVIIAEKGSQARDIRAAVGDRLGQILPAEGHLLRLAEPEEVDPAWQRWSFALLKPESLYPTKLDRSGNKPAKFKVIQQALKSASRVIIATDCDREGQLIGQEILEHVKFKGEVLRAIFTAQDPTTLRQAFSNLKPNSEYRHLYAAAVARQQADQIFNLSLTRAATKALVPVGVRGVIGIGRVKTPTLAIVCRRELEIRDFKPEDYFEIVAAATVRGGSFQLRHAPPPARRIKSRPQAEVIAAAAEGFRGPLSVKVEARRQAPPRLFDLPALQKTCGQRWGWTAEKTLAVAQELYDGEGKKLITYPRAEARYLAQNQIGDVPTIISALLRLRGFAALDLSNPVIRRGKSGHFHDKGLEGVSHHAVVPNVNVMADIEERIARLTDDEKRLFALVCRSYLAAMMPDYEYRQTTVLMDVSGHEFRAVGRIPLKTGWKAVYGQNEPEDRGRVGEEGDAEQALPPLADGETALLSGARVEEKRTQAPPRYNEGTLVDAMQNAWRFVEDPVQRERLKDAKGVGTPATRAAIIEGLKRQGLLALSGKWIVPTEAGLELHTLLSEAAPILVDPGTTALWELKLDGILQRASDVMQVVDEIAAEADRLVDVLKQQSGRAIALVPGQSTAAGVKKQSGRRRGTRLSVGRKSGKRRTAQASADSGSEQTVPVRQAASSTARLPTEKMISFARSLARAQKLGLPDGLETDYQVCRSFLDAHAPARSPDSPRLRSRTSGRRSDSANQPASRGEVG
jgi:DNA topoisomerase-3